MNHPDFSSFNCVWWWDSTQTWQSQVFKSWDRVEKLYYPSKVRKSIIANYIRIHNEFNNLWRLETKLDSPLIIWWEEILSISLEVSSYDENILDCELIDEKLNRDNPDINSPFSLLSYYESMYNKQIIEIIKKVCMYETASDFEKNFLEYTVNKDFIRIQAFLDSLEGKRLSVRWKFIEGDDFRSFVFNDIIKKFPNNWIQHISGIMWASTICVNGITYILDRDRNWQLKVWISNNGNMPEFLMKLLSVSDIDYDAFEYVLTKLEQQEFIISVASRMLEEEWLNMNFFDVGNHLFGHNLKFKIEWKNLHLIVTDLSWNLEIFVSDNESCITDI